MSASPRSTLIAVIPALAIMSAAPADARPTVSADLDLGTSTKPTRCADCIGPGSPGPAPLYFVGFSVRAGWRIALDRAPVWFLPELGAGYAVERFVSVPDGAPASSPHLLRFFGGIRIGWTRPLRPELRVEPSIFGHVGAGWYDPETMVGLAVDAGLAVDLRIGDRILVGAHAGYDMVRVAPQPGQPAPPCPVTAVPLSCDSLGTLSVPALVNRWVSYGIHAGWLFW